MEQTFRRLCYDKWFDKIIKINNNEYDWEYISAHPNVDWNIISKNINLPWNWNYVSINPNITIDIVKSNPNIDWNMINVYTKLQVTQKDLDDIENTHPFLWVLSSYNKNAPIKHLDKVLSKLQEKDINYHSKEYESFIKRKYKYMYNSSEYYYNYYTHIYIPVVIDSYFINKLLCYLCFHPNITFELIKKYKHLNWNWESIIFNSSIMKDIVIKEQYHNITHYHKNPYNLSDIIQPMDELLDNCIYRMKKTYNILNKYVNSDISIIIIRNL